VNFSDFVEDTNLTSELLSFIEHELAPSKKFAGIARKMKGHIKKKVKSEERSIRLVDAPGPELPPLFKEDNFALMDISPLEIARQLALIEFDLFKKIQPKECLKNWEKKQRQILAPNLNAVTM